MKNNFLYVIVVLILSLCQCSRIKYSTNSNSLKLIDLFVDKEKIDTDKQVLLMRFSKFPNQSNYLVELTAVNPEMYLDLNNTDKDLGTYYYKNFKISFTAEKEINTDPLLNNLKQISKEGFVNKNGATINYDPVTWKFYVDNNFRYISPFHNTNDQVKWDKEVRKYLKQK